MAWRRRRTIRRRPKRRLRRRFRRRYRKSRSANLSCKLTSITTLDVVVSDNHSYWLHFEPASFPEYTALAPSFEYCKFYKTVVTVMPMQNIADETHQMPAYAMLPWKDETNITSKGFNSICSYDKAKIYKGWQTGRMSFVPAVHADVFQQGSEPLPMKIEYKPVVRYSPTNETKIFNGLVMFQGFADITKTTHYNIRMDVYCKFYHQNTINI
ncbi:coat protein [Army ant associated cyclovirus 9]|uniref:Coat protein n=1 Tax=army ant associated cyclovirus 7 P4A-reste_1 TaxID=3070168 RepID=A0AA47KVD7_9CIRC|nr:coat protein [Army ant associated cyclovirus 9]WBG01483.1 coat protein [Army ant associated cyclovirus 9]